MTNHEQQNHPSQYDLMLPPIAPVLPSDERAVGLLARPEVRDTLQGVNDAITGVYRDMEAAGRVVHELFRGAAGDGTVVVVAEQADAANVTGIDPAAYESAVPIFGDRGGYVVFAAMLDGLGEPGDDGKPLATTPREVVGVMPTREGLMRVRFALSGGGVARVEVPVSPRLALEPTINGQPVRPFREAAFGERRMQAARGSLEWLVALSGAAWQDADASEGQEGGEARRAYAARVDAYHGARLSEMIDHPEWIDGPVQILPGLEDYLQAHPEALPHKGADSSSVVRDARFEMQRYRERKHIIDPDEQAALNAVVMPDAVITESPRAWEMDPEALAVAHRKYEDSYYKRDRNLARGTEGVFDRAVHGVRMSRMVAEVGEKGQQ